MAALRGEVVNDLPRTRYVRVDDYHIGFQVFGDGPQDVLFLRTNMNHLELQWEEPRFAAFLQALASFSRVIVYDDRGSGMSDPFPPNEYRAAKDRMDDVIAVLDKVGAERVALVAETMATFRAVHLAASHPERVTAVVFCDGLARATHAPDYAFGYTPDNYRAMDRGQMKWLEGASPELAAWLQRYARISVNRGTLHLYRQAFSEHDERDVRQILSAVREPTLVLEHAESMFPGAGRDLAERLPDATYKELPGHPVYGWWYPDPAAVADAIEEFITGEKRAPSLDRVLATVLFTDVVGSTARTAQLGDRRWRSTLDSLDEFAKRQIDRFGGKLIKSTGDGHLATFDSPGRAILCACALRDGVGRFELEIRAGLHTGEIELRGEDVAGTGVNIARRVCDAAADGEVLVSSAVPPLVAGSGLDFADRGEHDLKGVPGRWQLFAVRG